MREAPSPRADLPPAPDWCQPVKLPPLKQHDARIALAEMTGAAVTANGRIVHCRGWYDNLRKKVTP